MSSPIRRVVGVSLNAAIDRIAEVERLVAGGIHRTRLLSSVPGGKAVNTVRAAGRLGLPGAVVAVLGGATGAMFRDELAARSIPLHEVRVAGDTRQCLSILDRDAGGLTEFYELGITLAPDDWPRVEAALREALAEDPAGSVVVLAGSLPPGAPDDAYARLARLARDAGGRALVDVAGEPLRLAMAARPWLVKVNGDEAATVAGSGAEAPSTPDGALEAAQGLLLLGADTAIVTLGKAGAVWRAAERSLVLGAMPADMLGRFAVGSGDAFTAGLLAGLARGLPEADALQLAGGAGAANARTPGGGEFDPREAARNAARLQVEVIG